MSEVLQGGATSVSLEVMIRDSTTLQGKTGLLFSTAGLTFAYSRDLAAPVAITLVTQTVAGAYSSGGFVEKDATKTPGLYRLDIPNAAIASGVSTVRIFWTGASTMDDGLEIALVGYDPTTIDKTGFSLSATGLDSALDAASSIETGLTLRGFFRLMAAVLAGKVTVSGGTVTFRNAVADTKARVTATASSGNRTAVTTDQT